MKIHFVAKFQENLMDGSPAISRTDGRTHGRTDETDNYNPFPTKVGGLIHFVTKFQKNLMDGYPAISPTHGTDYNSPFPTKVRGLTMEGSNVIRQKGHF